MDDSKNIGALVNGLIRQQFFADQDITNEFLKNEIFPNMDSQEFTLLHNKYKGILKVGFISYNIAHFRITPRITGPRRVDTIFSQSLTISTPYRKFGKFSLDKRSMHRLELTQKEGIIFRSLFDL